MWRLWQNNCLQRQQHMWSSDLCVVTEKRRGKHHSAFCLSGNCLWLMISHKGLLGGSAAVFVGYMYEVRGVFGCTCAFKKKTKGVICMGLMHTTLQHQQEQHNVVVKVMSEPFVCALQWHTASRRASQITHYSVVWMFCCSFQMWY